MSFFTSSSGLTITGGNFTSICRPTQEDAAQVLRKTKDRDSCEFDDYAEAASGSLRKTHRCRSLDGLMIVKADEVDLHRELIRGISYRIHSASHHGRFVAVKTFEGPRAKQDWTVDVAFSNEFLHPNVLKIVGVSDERSKNHFVLFHGITSEQKMQSLIAKALRTDLNMSVRISMKAVKGIAAGLSYIRSQNIPMYPGTTNNDQKWENFNIFTGYDNEPIISFDPSSTVHENGSESQTFDNEIDGRGVEVLTGLCQQLFSEANSILYDDSPKRDFDVYDREGFLRATLEDAEGTSNVSESEHMSDPSNPAEKPKSRRTPRREVRWLDVGTKNRSLESIKRRFEDYLDRFLSSSSNSLLRHITSPIDNKPRHNIHQCPGYLREEITLASDVSKSVIISHAFPSRSEICSICGQLVQYKCTEPEKREAYSPNDSHRAPSSGLLSPYSPTYGRFPLELSDTSDSGSILTIPSPTLSNYSGHFLSTLQLRGNKPEEKSGLSSLRLLNPDSFTRHRRKSLDTLTDTDSNFSAWTPPFPSLSNRSVHFLPDQLRDNKPEEKSGLSSQSLSNPDTFKHHRKLSDIDSGSGWVPRSPTLSNHSGRSGPSHTNKPEESSFRFRRKGSNTTSSNDDVIKKERRTDDFIPEDFLRISKIPDNSPGRRPLSKFFSGLATILSRKSPGVRKDRSRQRFGSIG